MFKSKSVGFEVLGSNVIQWVDLYNMKKDLFFCSDVYRKFNFQNLNLVLIDILYYVYV